MGLEDKLNLIKNTKEDIRNIIIDKGVYVAENTPFNEYPNYIQQIAPKAIDVSGIQWTPDPLWWDIKTILENDTNEGDYAYLNDYGKCIALFNDTDNTFKFNLIGNTVTADNSHWHAVKTSDGQFYTHTGTSSISVTHTWDRTQDKQSSCPEVKTRYAICYKNPDANFSLSSTKLFTNCLAGISNNIRWCNTSTSASNNSNMFGDLCQSIKLLGKSSYTHKSTNNYIFSGISLQNLEFDCTVDGILTKSLNQCFKLQYLKLKPNNYSSINETTGAKTYDFTETGIGLNTLDVSDVDFSVCGSNIFTKIYLVNILGVINLTNNTLNTKYSLFTDRNYHPMTFSLNLPTNADVTINCKFITPETAKYLIENAPTITEAHTLTVPTELYNYLKCLEYTHLANYKGQDYSDGIQVLTLKGWTVISD